MPECWLAGGFACSGRPARIQVAVGFGLGTLLGGSGLLGGARLEAGGVAAAAAAAAGWIEE